jgi:RNA polymerase sigma-70 factor (ECF subfamily)
MKILKGPGAAIPPVDVAHRAAERVARESYGKLLALLVLRTRDVAEAEDALADAFAAALRTWPERGVPDNPDAWLLTAARHRHTDAARRRQTRAQGEEHLVLLAQELEGKSPTAETIPDRRLALMFACAHPAIEAGMRAPLILQTLLGLTAEGIAAAFLVPPGTMGQRLLRAKSRIRLAGIPLRIPEPEELAARLDAVLEAIYAAYAKGWSQIGEEGSSPLAQEALWLGRLVVSLLPSEPEAKGMLALMLYTEGRRGARRSAAGTYVPLDDQDTALWDRDLLRAAEGLLHDANAGGPTGRYQIEAAIQSAHIARRISDRDTRPQVLALYDHLLALTGSPVVALNRAAAQAAVDGPVVALDALDEIARDPRMLRYQPYWALRGHLLADALRTAEAYEAFTLALGLSTDDTVRRFLEAKRAALPGTLNGSGAGPDVTTK